MTLKNVRDSFCEYVFTAENVKLYIVEGYNSSHCLYGKVTDEDILHAHQWYELFFLEEGEMHCCFSDETCLLHAGELFMVKPGTLHYTDIAHSGGKITGVNFFFEILESSDSVPWLQLFSFEKYAILPFDQECRTLVSFFFRAIYNKQALLAGSYLFAFLTRLAYLQLPEKKDSADSDSDVGRIYKIDQIIQQHYKEALSLSDIAKELHLSERQLSRIIEKYYGCSYRDLIVNLRMQEAAVLLAKGVGVKDTAYRVGYESVRAFQNAFVKYYGKTPGSLHK